MILALKAQLHELNLLLEQGDLNALKQFSVLHDECGEALGGQLLALEDALQNLDLEAALGHSNHLMASLTAEQDVRGNA
jgi:hypothetical protein